MAEIKFASKEHENFYKAMIQKSGKSDSYHRAFFYCIGIRKSQTGLPIRNIRLTAVCRRLKAVLPAQK